MSEPLTKADVDKILDEHDMRYTALLLGRIQQLEAYEAVCRDPAALWSNWLRGTVKLPSGIGDVRQYQERIKRLEEAGDAMATWLSDPRNLGDDPFMSSQWQKAKEAKP